MTQMRLMCLIANVCCACYTMAEQHDDGVVLDNYDSHPNIFKTALSGVHTRSKRTFLKKCILSTKKLPIQDLDE